MKSKFLKKDKIVQIAFSQNNLMYMLTKSGRIYTKRGNVSVESFILWTESPDIVVEKKVKNVMDK